MYAEDSSVVRAFAAQNSTGVCFATIVHHERTKLGSLFDQSMVTLTGLTGVWGVPGHFPYPGSLFFPRAASAGIWPLLRDVRQKIAMTRTGCDVPTIRCTHMVFYMKERFIMRLAASTGNVRT